MVDDVKSQIVNSISAQTQPQINGMLNDMQGQIQFFLTATLVMSAIITIAFVINAIYKIRVERAILRIDRNVQKLVGAQTGGESNESPTKIAAKSPAE